MGLSRLAVAPPRHSWWYRAMKVLSDRGYPFPPVIIQSAVWLYLRYTLSFRDVEDLLAERGIPVSDRRAERLDST